MTTKTTHFRPYIAVVLALWGAFELDAQTTAFTYQGRLNDGTNAANGNYDIQASLQDAGSNVVAGPLIASATVNNGLFTIALDFGAAPLTGADRWLQLAVRTNGGGAFTPIFPRQPLMSAPYAVRAANAGNATTLSGTLAASQVAGTLALAQLPGAVLTNNAGGVNLTGSFAGNGTGVTNVSFNSLATDNITNFPIIAWGNNDNGQTNVPAGLTNMMAVAASFYHSLGLKTDGTVVAWGDNAWGQSTVPAGLSSVGAIAAGFHHSLALKSNGTVVTWGDNAFGQTNVPAGLSNVVAIAAGEYHSLAVKSDGTLVGWGENSFGQAAAPAGLSNVVAIAAGQNHNVALKSNGTVVAWGQNAFGQTNVPGGLSGVVAVAAGSVHSLALKSDGTIVGWGDNFGGQAVAPPGLSSVVAVAAGNGFSLALKSDGTVVVWGESPDGQTSVPAGLNHIVALERGGMARHVLVIQKLMLPDIVNGNLQVNGVVFGDGSGLTGLTASQIPNLDASKIISGTFSAGQIPSLDASKITTGTLADTRLSANVALLNRNQTFTGKNTFSDVTANGKVGIGTDTPATPLHVLSSGDAEISIQSSDADNRRWTLQSTGNSSPDLAGSFQIIDRTAVASRLTIYPDGNVLIFGNLTNLGTFIGDGSGLTGLTASQIPNLDASQITSGTFSAGQIPNLDASTITTGTLVDGQLSANVALLNRNQTFTGKNTFSDVTANGKVGIGTDTPATPLHVLSSGDAEISIQSSDADNRRWTLQSTGNSSPDLAGSFQIIDRTAVASRLTIYPDGNILIFGNLTNLGTFIGDGSGLTGLTASQIPNLDASKIPSGTFSTAQIPNLDASKITTGALTDGRLSGNVALLNGTNVFIGTNRFTGIAIVTNSNNQLSGTFSGNGSGLTGLTPSQIPNLDASKITTGALADARLSANVPLLNGTNVFIGTNRFTGVAIVTNPNNQLSGTHTGDGSGLTGLTASQIPNLDALKITSGTFSTAQIPNLDGSKITTGTLADGRLSDNVSLLNGTNVFGGTSRFTGIAIVTNANNQLSGTFSGNGSGLTGLTASQIPSLDGSKITTGTVVDARLSANVALLNGIQTFTGPNTFNHLNAFNNVGLGTNNPTTALHVVSPGDTEISIQSSDSGNHRWTLQSSGNGTPGLIGSLQMIDRTAGASRMTISTNGNVLIPGNITNSGSAVFNGSATFNGSTKVGANPVTVGVESLRILRGEVAGTGAIDFGSGFTVTKNGTGDITLNFSSSFSSTPAVTVTIYGNLVIPTLFIVDGSSAEIKFFNPSGMAIDPNGFDFIAIGP